MWIAKLKANQVVELRRLHKEGATIKELVKKYSMSDSNIRCILRGKTWKNVS